MAFIMGEYFLIAKGKRMTYDVAVIGAGVTGSMIARELSMHDIRVCVIEASGEIAAGASRANSGIVHAGYDAFPGSLKAEMNVAGCSMMKKTADELGVPYQNCGSLVVAFDKKDEAHLKELAERGERNGVPVEIISASQAKHIEPMLSEKVTRALYAGTAGIICPFTLTIAAAENAAVNGVEFFMNCRVTGIERQNGDYIIKAGDRRFTAKFLVNAAGIYADEISGMAGGERFSLHPRKGEYIIFDTAMEARTERVIFGAPTEKGKGVLAAPTVYGNMLAGPTARYIDDKEDKSTTAEGIAETLIGAKHLVPGLDKKYAITVFSGLRAVSGGDFIIERSNSAPNMVNVAGIESPGLTSAPAIAKRVADILFAEGLSDKKKSSAERERESIEVFEKASPSRKAELIDKDPRYGNVVCRCRHVTEAEVVQSIKRPCGATTVDGVKFRTGAGMGRCHGGFCMPRVMHILARELGSDLDSVTKSGEGSYILTGKTKGDK